MTESFQSNSLSGSSLKTIAIVAMLIDHIGAVLLTSSPAPYYIFRLIGRIAFPIFAFLLVEGYFHTKNFTKYCARLGLFALISEIPFDLAFSHTFFDPNAQNVFFTLFLGLLTVHGLETAKAACPSQTFLHPVCRIAALGLGTGLAWVFQTDYSAIGVLAITLLYSLRENRITASLSACALLCLLTPLELSAFAAVPLIAAYHGRRGSSLKYFFYLFYPLHLLLLAFLYWQI